LASAAGTALLQAEILADCNVPEDPYWKDYIYGCGRHPEMRRQTPFLWNSLLGTVPVLIKNRASIESSLSTLLQLGAFNSARSRHSGDWLLALPITSCGLKLDDETVRVAVGTRLALKLCIPHQCRCSSEVDSFGRHSLVCKRAPGRTV